MWLFVAILIILVLYLIVLSATKTAEMQNEKVDTWDTIIELRNENKELKELRKQEVHNNTVLLEKNRDLQEKYKNAKGLNYAIEDVVNGKRTTEEMTAKIKELLSENR